MSRTPANITQADVARAIRAAKQAGAAEVELRIGSKASIIVRMEASARAEETLDLKGEIVL